MNLLDAASPISGFPVLGDISGRHDVQDAMHEIRELLDPERLEPTALVAWLEGLSQEEFAIICTRSVERASHFKWFLGSSANGYAVWLHEYKLAQLPDAAGSFAASVHNHRYSFVSQVLTGSLHVSNFSFDPIKQFPVLSETRTILARSTYFLGSESIHRVDRAAPSTCTIIVQGPPERSYSRVFDLAKGTSTDMRDLPSRIPELISLLVSHTDRGSKGRNMADSK
ncbi:MAG TPA: hypothetical protein VME44_08835 [Streptosporangiaceae bacterium]|jgi:hypothetical protein|nr:hypothetical protein [Streptosporangiaceae bacterium]